MHALLGRLKVFLWKAAAVIHRGKLLDATGKAVYDRTQVPQLASGYNLKTVMAAVRFRVLESLQSLAKPPKKLNTAWEWTFYQDGAGAEVLKGCETDATDRYDHCSCRAMYVPVHSVCNRPCTRARACAFVVSKCLYACVRVRNAHTHRSPHAPFCASSCSFSYDSLRSLEDGLSRSERIKRRHAASRQVSRQESLAVGAAGRMTKTMAEVQHELLLTSLSQFKIAQQRRPETPSGNLTLSRVS